MDFLFLFKRRQITFLLIVGVVIGAHEYHNPILQHPASKKVDTGSKLEKSKVSYLSRNTYDNLFTGPGNSRLARSTKNDRSLSLTCNTINYFFNSQSGRRSICPFDWVVNYEIRRIPERIIEQVCLTCGSCGPSRHCAQIKTPYQVYFRDTKEFSQQIVRSGCACMTPEVGVSTNVWYHQLKHSSIEYYHSHSNLGSGSSKTKWMLHSHVH